VLVQVVGLVAIAALGVAACGGDDDDPQSVEEEIRDAIEEGNLDDLQDEIDDATDDGDLPDACALVTQADAEGLFGVEAVETEDDAAVDLGTSCIWENADKAEMGAVGHLLQVRVFDGEQFYGAEAYPDETELSDLGDRAFVRSGGGALGGVAVQFVQDGRTVTLDYTTVNIGVEEEADEVDATEREDQVVELARQASGRM
jgi:hypothetical protein